MKAVPGTMRQRLKRAVDGLATTPRPPKSKALELEDFPIEVRRLRLDRWRLIYSINEDEKTVDVLAVRKRPPYDYGDLAKLLADLDPRSDSEQGS